MPHLAADHACYAFQLKNYAEHFTCISVDLRGTGESDDLPGSIPPETLADDLAAFMEAIGVHRAHVSGLSLGGAVGLWLAAKYPAKVLSLSIHSCWPKTDLFIKTVLESWQTTARALASVSETLIRAMFPGASLLNCMPPGPITFNRLGILCDHVLLSPWSRSFDNRML